MIRRLVNVAVILGGVFLATFVTGSIIDPENIGGRLALYAVGILAFLAAVVLVIIALVRRSRSRT